MQYTLPMRNSSGKGISTIGCAACFLNNTKVQSVALLEKMEKLTPPGTRVAPKGKGLPRRNLKFL